MLKTREVTERKKNQKDYTKVISLYLYKDLKNKYTE